MSTPEQIQWYLAIDRAICTLIENLEITNSNKDFVKEATTSLDENMQKLQKWIYAQCGEGSNG